MQPPFLPSLVSFKPYTLGLPLCFTCISFSCPYSPPLTFSTKNLARSASCWAIRQQDKVSFVMRNSLLYYNQFELYVSTSWQTWKQAKPHELSCKVTFGNNCWNWWRGYSWKIFTLVNIKNWTATSHKKSLQHSCQELPTLPAENYQLCHKLLTNLFHFHSFCKLFAKSQMCLK